LHALVEHERVAQHLFRRGVELPAEAVDQFLLVKRRENLLHRVPLGGVRRRVHFHEVLVVQQRGVGVVFAGQAKRLDDVLGPHRPQPPAVAVAAGRSVGHRLVDHVPHLDLAAVALGGGADVLFEDVAGLAGIAVAHPLGRLIVGGVEQGVEVDGQPGVYAPVDHRVGQRPVVGVARRVRPRPVGADGDGVELAGDDFLLPGRVPGGIERHHADFQAVAFGDRAERVGSARGRRDSQAKHGQT